MSVSKLCSTGVVPFIKALAIDLLRLQPLQYAKIFGLLVSIRIASKVVYALFFSPLRNIPGPFLSRVSNLPKSIHSILKTESYYHEHNTYKYGNIYVYGPSNVAISDYSDCKRALSTHKFQKGGTYRAFRLIGETLFSITDPKTSHIRRRQIGPAFIHGNLLKMEKTILECGTLSIKAKLDALIEEQNATGSPAGGPAKKVARVNYNTVFSLATLDIIGVLSVGKQFHALENNDFKLIEWVDSFNYLSLLRYNMPLVKYYPFSLFIRRLSASADEFVRFGSAAILDRRRELREAGDGAPRKSDILQTFIDAEQSDSGSKMTQGQVVAETIGILLAGIDTTATTLTWTIHHLMLYPEAYHRAVAEVRAAYAPEHTIGYSEGRSNLPYLEACIYESMRIQAATDSILPRIVPEGGARFQGHFLPQGTTVSLSITGVNHNPGVWESPRRFVPERFLENPEAKNQIMTFSTGVRVCPGRNLAFIELITILANLLKDYDLALPEDSMFGPGSVDENGLPIMMPRVHALVSKPKNPEHDCIVLVSKAAPQ